jgi:hypothetical protein
MKSGYKFFITLSPIALDVKIPASGPKRPSAVKLCPLN